VPVISHLPAELLDYVETHSPPADSPYGISQRELAKAFGYHPCSMSRPLADLVQGGFLKVKRGPVRGAVRKQLVYVITDAGRAELQRRTRDVPLHSGAIPPPPNPFVGRKDELRALKSYAAERGGVVFVEGPPGMGKTALVTMHMRRIRAGKVPFWFSVRGASSSRHFTLSLAHALAAIGAQQLAYYAQLPREPLGREVADLAQRAIGSRDFIGVVDDFHMASPELRRFLEDFAVGLVEAQRHTVYFVGQEPPFFARPGIPIRRIEVGGLDRPSAHELTDRRGGLADRFETVFQSTLGSPLLLQLAVAVPGVEATPAQLPAAAVDRLTDRELSAIVPIALANEPLPISFVLETSGEEEAALNRLVRGGILQRTLEGRVEILQVVRNAISARIKPAQEKDAHLKLALFYGRSRRPEAVRERFLHLVAAEDWHGAAPILSNQETTLLALGYSDAFRNAVRQLASALPKGAARIRALQFEARVLRMHSEYSEALLRLRRAMDEAQGDRRTEAECLLQMVELHVRMQQLPDAEALLADARRLEPFTRRMQIALMMSEARIVEAKGDLPKARELFQEAFQSARRHRFSDLAMESVARWSRLASFGGAQEAALNVCEEGLPGARKAGRMDLVFELLLTRSRTFSELNRKQEAERDLKQIRTEAETLGYLSHVLYALSGLSAIATENENWASAISFARQASSLADRLGNEIVLGHSLALLCTAEMRSGQLEEARTDGERSVTVLSRLAPTDSLMLAHAYLSEVYLSLGRRELANQEYERARKLADRLGMSWWKERIEKELGERVTSTVGASEPGPTKP
jgi:tetratricopeptide (TPR) repeat protein/DNA-binding MarR family transcriptional regulator